MYKQTVKRDDWELIENELYNDTARMSVPGGWLLRERLTRPGDGVAVKLIFIPDENHKWRLKND